MWRVSFERVDKDLWKLPQYIRLKIQVWADAVEQDGMPIVRMSRGLHDKPLQGNRKGQRSINVNRSWRLIYEEKECGEITIIEVQEVTYHDY